MQDHRSQGDGKWSNHWIWTLCADMMSTAYRTKQKNWMVSNYEKWPLLWFGKIVSATHEVLQQWHWERRMGHELRSFRNLAQVDLIPLGHSACSLFYISLRRVCNFKFGDASWQAIPCKLRDSHTSVVSHLQVVRRMVVGHSCFLPPETCKCFASHCLCFLTDCFFQLHQRCMDCCIYLTYYPLVI